MAGDLVVHSTRAVVVGTGISGLSAALALGDCTVVSRTDLGDGSSRHAQGGIAAALGTGDGPGSHAADTLAVAAGLGDPVVAEAVAAAAEGRIEWLVEVGADFDRRADGSLVLGREAGHSARRIVHARGDATGAEAMRALVAATRARPDIAVADGLDLVDLLRDGDRVTGVLTVRGDGTFVAFVTPAVVLATGGIGFLYERTTNPMEVAGDGLAAAARAGARLADLEFVQFHPTALAVDADPVPLVTEALRGEGAILVDEAGGRFMRRIHPDAELAPRDVVARGIWSVLARGGSVHLDATAALGDAFASRFPTVHAAALRAGIDPSRHPLPVTPAEHYHMGGVATDLDGRTSLPGLWAVGEVASTGLHGGNRLASNSLLEGMVLGARAAATVRATPSPPPRAAAAPVAALDVVPEDDPGHVAAIRSLMWRRAGLVRSGEGLRSIVRSLPGAGASAGVRNRNLPLLAELVATAALKRTESRGSHYRSDHPVADPAQRARQFVTPSPVPAHVVARGRTAA